MEHLLNGGGLLLHAAMGVGLAASAGLRAFLPLFVVGLAARLGWVPLGDSFAWLESTPALVVFGVAVVIELIADKLPIVDHTLDVLQTVVKPVAGAFVMLSVVSDTSPLYLAVVWIALGGSLAGAVHATKANLRIVSTVATGGLGNPVLSAGEDVGAIAVSAGAILAPVFAAIAVLIALALGWLALRRLRRPALGQSA